MTAFESRLPDLINSLANEGWAICDDFLCADEVRALRQEGERRLVAGEFHRAGVGRGSAQQIRDDIRGDAVRWLDPHAPSDAERCYWSRIESLKCELNRQLFLGIREGEFHYASYPVGSFYQRHIDRFRDDDARTVSVVCYLNDAWETTHGGQIRLWLGASPNDEYLDISPIGGRLVLFMSDRFWHAVQPANRVRWSLTGWMRR
ncbi:2OG-Fe(II) oxygenase [Chitinimonas sp. BJYL2]|uniref:2OG-Fe(II) oxygenase n=1 Tax=Chitinimonas sp. BJYL2 TaxID=2976696 RepID=UPI0022B48C5B|nr:2OG-Fe(II) oxygenase [Chitinimonas sp. BJYL2]